ncbi:MAG: leucyl aminopeptidase [Parachlamydiales bacterium]|nr:leucyl aminopeptidase [Parachlamydiales bacterium]
MDFSATGNDKRKEADLLVVPYCQLKQQPKALAEVAFLKDVLKSSLESGDFKAKEGEVLICYGTKTDKRIALLGLGPKEKITAETIRRAYSCLIKCCIAKKIQMINIMHFSVEKMHEDTLSDAIAEGMLLTNYSFNDYRTNKDLNPTLVKHVTLVGAKASALARFNKAKTIAQGVYLVRDLVNRNADEVTPQYLSAMAQKIAKDNPSIKVTTFDKKRIVKERLDLLLAVNKGSDKDPAFIVMEYKGDSKSKDKTVLVGKGITYDTGGLNLKPTGSMETMKCDMAGAATVIGTLLTAAQLKLKINLSVVVPSTENSIGSKSYKPGDVQRSYSGKMIEIDNTDAEGRLVLADALAWAKDHLAPTRIIDLATLTGAMVIALGEETTGFLSNDDEMSEQLTQAGLDTFERIWRLPNYEEYKDQLKSDFADMKNSGGRPGGSITAGLFLQEFIADIPWVHFDIAGTAYLSKERRYHPKNATGIGVRLLIKYLESL